jgi:Zn finger protein HypA/HybF involved in hydrogenase expression
MKDKVAKGTASSRTMKRFLLNEFGEKCWKCGITEWNKQPIVFELEHNDGNSENNSKENLSILCPNCHSQTDTYKSKNKGKGRHSRRIRYQEGKSY